MIDRCPRLGNCRLQEKRTSKAGALQDQGRRLVVACACLVTGLNAVEEKRRAKFGRVVGTIALCVIERGDIDFASA